MQIDTHTPTDPSQHADLFRVWHESWPDSVVKELMALRAPDLDHKSCAMTLPFLANAFWQVLEDEVGHDNFKEQVKRQQEKVEVQRPTARTNHVNSGGEPCSWNLKTMTHVAHIG